MDRKRMRGSVAGPGVAALLACLALTAAGCGTTQTNGAAAETGNCDAACEPAQPAVGQSSAGLRAGHALTDSERMRDAAVAALDHAIGDFTYRRPPSAPFDSDSPARRMLDRLSDLRARLQGAGTPDIGPLYDQARALLDEAYVLGVDIGMLDPQTIGQRDADETWWYISS